MIKNYIFSLKKSLILSKIAKKKKDINYKKIIITRFASLILLIFISCKDNSSNLPKQFASYDEAVNKVENANFKIEENADVEGKSENNWIESAKYFANDEQSGFLIINMKGKEYIFDEVPITVWNDFKSSDDMGKYYNQFIRGKYILTLTNQSNIDTQCRATTNNGNRCKRTATHDGFCFQHQQE